MEYLKRLLELVVVTFAGGAASALSAGGWDLSAASLGAALSAGIMALYGVVVKGRGEDAERPTLK